MLRVFNCETRDLRTKTICLFVHVVCMFQPKFMIASSASSFRMKAIWNIVTFSNFKFGTNRSNLVINWTINILPWPHRSKYC